MRRCTSGYRCRLELLCASKIEVGIAIGKALSKVYSLIRLSGKGNNVDSCAILHGLSSYDYLVYLDLSANSTFHFWSDTPQPY
jgi:hypothetical protein